MVLLCDVCFFLWFDGCCWLLSSCVDGVRCRCSLSLTVAVCCRCLLVGAACVRCGCSLFVVRNSVSSIVVDCWCLLLLLAVIWCLF